MFSKRNSYNFLYNYPENCGRSGSTLFEAFESEHFFSQESGLQDRGAAKAKIGNSRATELQPEESS